MGQGVSAGRNCEPLSNFGSLPAGVDSDGARNQNEIAHRRSTRTRPRRTTWPGTRARPKAVRRGRRSLLPRIFVAGTASCLVISKHVNSIWRTEDAALSAAPDEPSRPIREGLPENIKAIWPRRSLAFASKIYVFRMRFRETSRDVYRTPCRGAARSHREASVGICSPALSVFVWPCRCRSSARG